MSQTLTYVIGSDRRALVDNIQDFKVDFGDDNQNWVQARQFERGMRQVFVNVVNEDGTPFDLTGCNVWFEGLLPKTANGDFRVIDSDGYVPLDSSAGKFRFDMPGHAFTVAGSYRQAFFRIVKNGNSVTTLEFDLDVLADKVIDGLVPKDWIGPFEQIADQLVDDLQKHTDAADKIIADFQQKVTDLVNQLNQQGSTTTSMLTELQNRITDLETKIKQDGLMTQAEFNEKMQSIDDTIQAQLTKINQPTELTDSAAIGGLVNPNNLAELNDIKSKIDATKFNLIFITDMHYGKWGSEPDRLNNTTIRHLNNALYLDDSVDTIVAGGDNIDGWTMSLDGIVNDQQEITRKMLFDSPNHSDKFILKGNHDDGSGRLLQWQSGTFNYIKWLDGVLGYSSAAPMMISDDQIKSSYHTGDLLFGERRDGDSLYFYKDYPNKKVRLIGLNSNDDPNILDDAGNPKYFGIQHMGYQQQQLNWLANVALQNVPDDYVVLIMGHIPATANGTDQNNQSLVNQIINAFQVGTPVHAIGTDADWKVDVTADYSTQGRRTVAAYINGHLHAEFLNTSPGFNSISVTSSINSTSDGTAPADKDIDGWDLITIDTSNRSIKITGFGRATDRNTTY